MQNLNSLGNCQLQLNRNLKEEENALNKCISKRGIDQLAISLESY